ncbi:hypothetical protein GpartN1_g5685.t1 [Galdieria partita]|uniref:Flavodoxin-like domain-containing protein n=1 Tax=Galdieria partita TaxID=83374 RepID=A0A9C7Q142_9RHOD|nr:hypothetical protein GpartN1_g5685.t1 [Galdieria partita]
MPRILVLYYSMYGHIKKLADQIAEGIRQEGCEVVIYQAPETLSEDVLKLMKAPPKPSDPVFTFDKHSILAEADGVIFGFPTRFGMMCAQMKAVFDSFGHLWQSGALTTKPAGLFFSTGSQGGGQETTAFTAITQLAHLGMVFVPVGYTFGPDEFRQDRVQGGSAYGAGTYAGADGSRQPIEYELARAKHQGSYFAKFVKRLAPK